MKVAVTGGSGVVGKAVVQHLVEAGHEVRALARSEAAAGVVHSLGAEPMPGDVLDEPSVERLVSGAEQVFHVAGVNEMCSRDPSRMWRVNVDGSVIVLEASARAGARRLIHTSSAVTIGEAHRTVGTEASLHRGSFLSEYERSKTEAERLVLGTHRHIEVVAVNPSSVQGPGRSTGTGAILLAAAKGSLPVLVDTTISIVDIRDCARGHLLAALNGKPGERYLLSGAVLTVREAVRMLNGILGRTRSPWFIRPEAVVAVTPLVDAASRLAGRRSPLCAESARVLLHGHRHDGSKATRELGLEYTPIESTLEQTVDWFAESGLI